VGGTGKGSKVPGKFILSVAGALVVILALWAIISILT
jgi:hypothetical protein